MNGPGGVGGANQRFSQDDVEKARKAAQEYVGEERNSTSKPPNASNVSKELKVSEEVLKELSGYAKSEKNILAQVKAGILGDGTKQTLGQRLGGGFGMACAAGLALIGGVVNQIGTGIGVGIGGAIGGLIGLATRSRSNAALGAAIGMQVGGNLFGGITSIATGVVFGAPAAAFAALAGKASNNPETAEAAKAVFLTSVLGFAAVTGLGNKP